MKHSITTYKNWLYRVRNYGIRNTFSLLRNLRKDGCFALKYGGNDLYLRGNTVDFAVVNSILVKGEYDFSINFKPEIIIDAGAYTGVSAIYFCRKYPGVKIIAVEPEESNFNLLVRNTRPYKNIYCVRGAIYGENARLAISDTAAEKYAFRVEQCAEAEGYIAGYTIDTLMKNFQLQHVDIIKMDIEGAEYSVFSHDTSAWLPSVKVLVLELHEFIHKGTNELVVNVLKNSGFTINRRGENLIASRDIDEKVSGFPFSSSSVING
jgi:FkbM family methyltransferase